MGKSWYKNLSQGFEMFLFLKGLKEIFKNKIDLMWPSMTLRSKLIWKIMIRSDFKQRYNKKKSKHKIDLMWPSMTSYFT